MVWIALVAVPVVPNILILPLAYKIQKGAKPLDETEREEIWTRAIYGALMLAGVTVAFVLLDWFITDWAGFPSGPIHLFVFIAYVPAAVWVLFIAFGYTDYLEGLSVFTIAVSLSVLALVVVNAVTGLLEGPFNYVATWMPKPS